MIEWKDLALGLMAGMVAIITWLWRRQDATLRCLKKRADDFVTKPMCLQLHSERKDELHQAIVRIEKLIDAMTSAIERQRVGTEARYDKLQEQIHELMTK